METESTGASSDDALQLSFMRAALAGCAQASAAHIHKTMSEKQKKDPTFACAIMAEHLSRAALHAWKNRKAKTEKGEAAPW